MKSFLVSDGSGPLSRLLLAGDALYGTTQGGGKSGAGVVFKQPITPPVILAGPDSCTAEAGTDVSFQVVVESCVEASYQWLFNGTNPITVSNATARLDLTQLQFSNSGAYTLVITNYFGAVTSAVARLNVIPVVPRRPAPFLTLQGETGSALQVECLDGIATNTAWAGLATLNVASNPVLFGDPTLQLPPLRFYRTSQFTLADAPSVLGLQFVPGILLTGNPGDKRRVDFINAIGPVDAWSPLGTITLTNSPQLFFDSSAHDQPRRLYRIVPLP
jgi:uncharacterized repeat protein (TIGR03803 family)